MNHRKRSARLGRGQDGRPSVQSPGTVLSCRCRLYQRPSADAQC
jgi:hypothetical protein